MHHPRCDRAKTDRGADSGSIGRVAAMAGGDPRPRGPRAVVEGGGERALDGVGKTSEILQRGHGRQVNRTQQQSIGQEARRLETLRSYAVLDTPNEEEL